MCKKLCPYAVHKECVYIIVHVVKPGIMHIINRLETNPA